MPDKKISALTLKATPVIQDETVIVDSSDGLNKKIKLQFSPVNAALTSALSSKADDTGDALTGQYTITNNDSDPQVALNIWNQDPDFISGVGIGNDVDNCGFAVLNTNFTYLSPYVNPGDLILGLSGVSSAVVALCNSANGFNIVQDGSVVASVTGSGLLTATKIDAAPIDIDGLPAKSTPVGTDEATIYDSVGVDNKKIKLQNIPITTAETARLNNFQDSLYVRYVPTVATNSTTNVLIDSVLIPANTFSSTDIIDLKTLLFEKVGVTNSATWTVFVNTSNTLTGATSVASSSIATANQYGVFTRKYFLTGGLIYSMVLSTTNSDVTATGSAWATATFNPTVTNYILLAVRVTNAADTIKCLGVQFDRK